MTVIIIVTISLSIVAIIGSSIVATLNSSFLSLFYDRSLASSTASSAQIAVQCFIFPFP